MNMQNKESIIDKVLDSPTLSKYVFRRIADSKKDEYLFISKDSKKEIEKYVEFIAKNYIIATAEDIIEAKNNISIARKIIDEENFKPDEFSLKVYDILANVNYAKKNIVNALDNIKSFNSELKSINGNLKELVVLLNSITSNINNPDAKATINETIQKTENLIINADNRIKEIIKEIEPENNGKKKLDPTKEVWKNLLIDAVSMLKFNDTREKIYNEFKDIYTQPNGKETFVERFNQIRKVSSYGIEELNNYFEDFIEYESVLYGMNKYYRDHKNHVLQVWAIGIGLLELFTPKGGDVYNINEAVDFHFQLSNQEQDNNISKSELWSMWTIIALCHDLGYPIEKTAQINKQAKKIITHFGNMQFSELDYNFNILNTFLVEKFLNIISSKVYTKIVSEKREFKTGIQTKYRDKLSKSLEDYKHGVFSSLLLFKNLTYFLETDYFMGNETLSSEDARQFYIRKDILRSIAGHTCPKMYHINMDTIAFLLILCDELQEWNRPKSDSLLNAYKDIEPVVKIKEFDMDVDSGIHKDGNKLIVQKICIQMRYNINSNQNHEEYLVKNRYKNIHYLLRSAKEDYDRKIFFQWDIKFNDKNYSFVFNSNKSSFDQLKCSKRGKNGDEEETIELYN